MSNLGDPLATDNNIQGRSRTFLEIWGAVVNALASAGDIGPGIPVIDAIIGILDPPPGSSQPSLQDLLNKLNEFTTFVANALAHIDKTIAGGQ